jgi:ribonuclease PH
MANIIKRAFDRPVDSMRPVVVTYNIFGYASGSVLVELGNTKVLCSVNLQNSVPLFLKRSKKGWLTAEYEMLPTATQARVDRPSSTLKKNNRSVEISRFIGRVLRAIVNTDKIDERTIIVDCDVLQADGSTRVAAICGAYLALRQAFHTWIEERVLPGSVSDYLMDEVAAVSVGMYKNNILLDIDYAEDNQIDADFNFVLTRSGSIVELQGSGEKSVISWQQFDEMRALAIKGVMDMFQLFDTLDFGLLSVPSKAPLFSLARRKNSSSL